MFNPSEPRSTGEPYEIAPPFTTEFPLTSSHVALKLGKGDALLEIGIAYLDQSEAIRLCIAE
ncbi:hypothetical protein Q8W37_18735 [Shimia thalassica]|uniref:hypothetical protein n=1 Tax=Shimia thalassica TaxID=1715693 RepID=UPI0027336F34|nr:hypothetical protein [Shimia thalassica]MDP2520639.1 hypothetical protein [Shimia thalassica]MDP2581985.1 hypothetical protein [Shimia thalassica]